MQNVLAPITGLSLDGSLFNPATAAATWRYSYAPQSCTDDQFVAMLNAYRGSGGLAREANLLALSSRRCGFEQILAELIPVYDLWELANWFVQPNPWLADRLPADALEHDPSAVLQAARADRFIANN